MSVLVPSVGEEERFGCFTIVGFLLSRYCYCSVSLPSGAVAWSALCGWDISGHTYLCFEKNIY